MFSKFLEHPYIKLHEIVNPRRQVLILYYHRVLPRITGRDPFRLQVTAQNFRRQIEYLRLTYPLISLHEFVRQIREGILPRRRQIVITFDDGYRDNYLYAYPVLKEWQVPATIFLSTDSLETQSLFFWERLYHLIYTTEANSLEMDLPEKIRYSVRTDQEKYEAFLQLHKKLKAWPPAKILQFIAPLEKSPHKVNEEHLPLTWEQIREMNGSIVSFGAHTCSHPVLSTLSEHEAEQEIVQSKHIIEERLQQEINLFAYPYGTSHDFNQQTMSLVKRHNFLCACSTCFGSNTVSSDLFAIKRVVVQNWDAVSLARKIAHVFRHQEWVL